MAVRTVASIIIKILLVSGHVGVHINISSHNGVVEGIKGLSRTYVCNVQTFTVCHRSSDLIYHPVLM